MKRVKQVLRTFYIPTELDARLAARASVEGISKSEFIRRCCLTGLAVPVEPTLAHRTIDLEPEETKP